MTLQEVFDGTVQHLAKQGRPAIGKNAHGDNVCQYRTDWGGKCGVGFWIPDDAYVPEMDFNQEGESLSADALIIDHGSRLPIWFRSVEPLFTKLQSDHDANEHFVAGVWNVPVLRTALITTAHRFDLHTGAVDKWFPAIREINHAG